MKHTSSIQVDTFQQTNKMDEQNLDTFINAVLFEDDHMNSEDDRQKAIYQLYTTIKDYN